VSDAYLDRAREQEHRGFYLDPIRIVEGHATRKTPTTPCITLYRALAQQLEDITAGVQLPADFAAEPGPAAWEARFEVHRAMQRRTLEWAAGHGLEPFPVPAGRSATVSCIRSGEIDVPALIAGLLERGHEIGNGYGDLKNETFRIGHMGDHTPDQLEELLAAADEVLTATARA
jgi:aspartate aminotransferase-like enzyme